MTTEKKKVFKLNDVIFHVGDWDFCELKIITNQYDIDNAMSYNIDNKDQISVPNAIYEIIQTNPLPIGAVEDVVEMTYSELYGWRELSWTPEPVISNDDILKQNITLQDKISLLEDVIAEMAMKIY